MKVTLATPEKLVYSDDAEQVKVIADKGQLQILPRHANLITLVHTGPINFTDHAGVDHTFQVTEGVLKVENSEISILVNSAKSA